MKPEKVFALTFAGVYPHYVRKAETKGRTKEELEEYLKRDPIIVLRTQLQQAGQLTDDEFAKLDEEVKAVVQDSWDFAEQSPEPPIEALHEDVVVDTTSDAHAEAAVAAD